MKRICVFSDSHGYADHMLRVIGRERPDLVIHLGDGEADLAILRAAPGAGAAILINLRGGTT